MNSQKTHQNDTIQSRSGILPDQRPTDGQDVHPTKHWIQHSFITVILAITLIILAGIQNQHLATSRLHTLSPTYSTPHSPPSTLHSPPSLAPVLLAGFRGLAADILWLRAADLQDQGRYFELVQLADWITTMEPHLTEVWAVHAWNMAYNISIMMPNDEMRWTWIKNAVKLLRDRGIPLNSTNPKLYTELAFIYLNKIGNPTDLSAQYYKRQWAKEMMALFGETGILDFSYIQTDNSIKNRLQDYRLSPKHMHEIDDIYGPLDWRMPQTHALYWAYMGNIASGSNIHNPRCERTIYQSMTAIFESGKLTYNADSDVFVTSTNFEILPKVIATFEQALLHAINALPQKAYANFLASAIATHKFYHHEQEAHDLFDMLHDRFPSQKTQLGYEAFTKRLPKPTLPQILAPKTLND